MSATPRLFVTDDLAQDQVLSLDQDQSHYLRNVLRLGVGGEVRLFNGRQGEFAASVTAATKRDVSLALGRMLREQSTVPDLWLLFAPLKKTRTDFVVEKAVELGVAEIRPVITQRCEVDTVRTERLARIATEAAEQTERLDVPPVRDAASLGSVLDGWSAGRALYFCDEAGDDGGRPWGGDQGRAQPLANVIRSTAGGPAAFLIGPEGGFTPAERDRLRSLPFVRPVGLGPRILRAETAAMAALSIWQSVIGDWRAD